MTPDDPSHENEGVTAGILVGHMWSGEPQDPESGQPMDEPEIALTRVFRGAGGI